MPEPTRMPPFPLKQIVLPKIKPGPAIAVILTIAALGVGSTIFYTIDPEELGVIRRFGKFIDLADPGLHFKLPLGIDTVVAVPVLRQEKQEFGFRTAAAGISTRYDSTRSYDEEALMVTGDRNAAVVEWIVQYRIDDPEAYLFKVRNPLDTLRDATESVMRQVVGDRTVDEVLTVGRQQMADEAEILLQRLMNEYQLGIRIDKVVPQDVNPPDRVRASFDEVNEAQQERERSINEARAEFNRVIPRAEGEADQMIAAAEGYAMERVNRAEGDASRFTAMLKEYLKAPKVTRRRIYLETMQEIIPKLGRKLIIDENTQGVLPLLQINAQEALRP